MSSTPNLVSQWDCSSSTNSGIFTLTGDCTISGNSDVFVITTLEITGDPYTKHLTIITKQTTISYFIFIHTRRRKNLIKIIFI